VVLVFAGMALWSALPDGTTVQSSCSPQPSSWKGCPLSPALLSPAVLLPSARIVQPLPRRRALARWVGAAPLILLTALTACTVTHENGKYNRSFITGSAHRDGDPLNIVGVNYKF
jgi:hypothetical protein